MNLNISIAKISRKDLRLLIALSIAITVFLFFIDEGYYNFQWMKSPFTWLIFLIYFAFILAGQLLISTLIQKSLGNKRAKWISIISGTLIGLMFLITVVFN